MACLLTKREEYRLHWIGYHLKRRKSFGNALICKRVREQRIWRNRPKNVVTATSTFTTTHTTLLSANQMIRSRVNPSNISLSTWVKAMMVVIVHFFSKTILRVMCSVLVYNIGFLLLFWEIVPHLRYLFRTLCKSQLVLFVSYRFERTPISFIFKYCSWRNCVYAGTGLRGFVSSGCSDELVPWEGESVLWRLRKRSTSSRRLFTSSSNRWFFDLRKRRGNTCSRTCLYESESLLHFSSFLIRRSSRCSLFSSVCQFLMCWRTSAFVLNNFIGDVQFL